MTETALLTLRAEFNPDDSKKRLGFTGARCELPNGQVIETTGRRSPLYALARKLEALGFGDWALQAYTPTGTKSLRGKVSVMAKRTQATVAIPTPQAYNTTSRDIWKK